ncbi:MAG: Vacuolar protease A [Bogoriella megaspora]|nr:MAG: Vacuolar protease A [Bogoriella megaspora]
MKSLLSVIAFAHITQALPRLANEFDLFQSTHESLIGVSQRTIKCPIQAVSQSAKPRRPDRNIDAPAVGAQIPHSPYPSYHENRPWDYNGWLYFVNITVGTPPQTFRAAIDIGFSDLFVPSINCVGSRSCIPHLHYNSSQSKTYIPNGTAVHVYYHAFFSSGYASTDTLQIGDLTIENQSFEEATDMRHAYLFWYANQFDSVLGLPPAEFYPGSERLSATALRATSPFHNMIKQKLLQKNTFSVRLSQNDSDDRGELLFGGMNSDLFIEPLHTFALTANYSQGYNKTFWDFSPGWQVAVNSLALQDHGRTITYLRIEGYVAAFFTGTAFIGLPRAIAVSLAERMGVDDGFRLDCSLREIAPDLVIYLGDKAIPFVLKPEDYIREQPKIPYFGRGSCQLEIVPWEGPEGDTPSIVLGSVFLARFYSVFDWDNATISRKSLRYLRQFHVDLSLT